jgi:3-isopropylmalate dehydrogenase
VANPAAMLLSAALMLEHGLDLQEEARLLSTAVDTAIDLAPTPDLGGNATTHDVVAAVLVGLGR